MKHVLLWRDEHGSASLEFITLGMLLFIPLVYLVLSLAQIEAASFAAEGAARQAARVFVTAPNLVTAQQRVNLAVRDVLADINLPPESARSSVSCQPSANCLLPDAFVTASTSISVPLPLIPAIFNLEKFARVTVVGSATEVVPR